jgi:NADH-quinone oxidoreductase subunit A
VVGNRRCIDSGSTVGHDGGGTCGLNQPGVHRKRIMMTMSTFGGDMLAPYASIVFAIALIGAIACAMLLLAHFIRPAKKGPVKDSTYESGMPPIGDARGRFNVRFYIVAMLFLLFDVEVVFLWPWALVFHKAAREGYELATPAGDPVSAGFLLVSMGMFAAFLVVGFAYEWRRGMFEWD